MKKEKYSGIAFILFAVVILQSYLQETETFASILGSTISFFIPLIWAMFFPVCSVLLLFLVLHRMMRKR